MAQPGDVTAATAVGEPGALREIGAVEEGPDKLRNLGRVSGAVSVDHGDDIAGCRGEPAGQGVALAGAVLRHDPDVWAQPTGGGHRVVNRVPVDDDDLVQAGWQFGEDMRQVTGLVERGDDHGDLRPGLEAGSKHRQFTV